MVKNHIKLGVTASFVAFLAWAISSIYFISYGQQSSPVDNSFMVDKDIPAYKFYMVESTLVILTDNEIYRWNDVTQGRPERVGVGLGGHINRSHQMGNTLLFAIEPRLYRWNDALKGKPELVSVNLGQVFRFHQVGSTVLLGTMTGLYRWDNVTQGKPELVGRELEFANRFYQVRNTLLINTSNGLYRWNDELKGKPELVDRELVDVYAFQQLSNTLLLGAAENGLYRWDDVTQGKPERVDVGLAFGSVGNIYRVGSTLLIDAATGMYRWNDELKGKPELVKEEDSNRLDQEMSIFEAIQVDSTLLLMTPEKLYRWNDMTHGMLERVDMRKDMGMPTSLKRLGNTSLYGTDNGLYRWDDVTHGRPEPVNLGLELWDINASQQVGSTLLIGTTAGLLRIDGVGIKWNAKIEVDELSGPFFSDSHIPIHWKVGNYERRATPQTVLVQVLVKDKNGKIDKDADGTPLPLEGWQVIGGENSFSTPKLLPGTYSLIVRAVDLTGNTSDNKPIYFIVYSSPAEVMLEWGRILALTYTVITVLVFLALFLGARKSKRCFEILTDPLTRKFGIYFGFALRYLTPVRIWVFERYFDNLKKDWPSNDNYVPYYLIPPADKFDGEPADLIDSIKIIQCLGNENRILIVGGPGTGKTALVKNLMQTYCQQPSLRAAWKRYGFIPIWVNLRELASSSDMTVIELARSALEGQEVKFDEKDLFFDLLLGNGGFLIILDGLNEVNIDSAVNKFAAIMPSVKLLLTSQTDLVSDSFKRYRLPFFDPDFAKTLLRKFIGFELANKTIQEVPELWPGIKCGYDVRLIEQIVRTQEAKKQAQQQTTKILKSDQPKPPLSDTKDSNLPRNRLELYEAMVKLSDTKYEKEKIETRAFPWAVVCERAWKMWIDRQRRFQPDENLTDTDVKHLGDTNIVVKRSNGYEFSHDLMRAFLSALWCARYTHSIDLIIEQRLKGNEAAKVWTLSPDDQTPTFTFLTELIENQEGLEQIAQFAAEKVGERQQLMIAVQEVAKKKSWPIQVKLSSLS